MIKTHGWHTIAQAPTARWRGNPDPGGGCYSVPGREGTPVDVALAVAMAVTLERLIAADPREREQ